MSITKVRFSFNEYFQHSLPTTLCILSTVTITEQQDNKSMGAVGETKTTEK